MRLAVSTPILKEGRTHSCAFCQFTGAHWIKATQYGKVMHDTLSHAAMSVERLSDYQFRLKRKSEVGHEPLHPFPTGWSLMV
jgi:hypothetical protein